MKRMIQFVALIASVATATAQIPASCCCPTQRQMTGSAAAPCCMHQGDRSSALSLSHQEHRCRCSRVKAVLNAKPWVLNKRARTLARLPGASAQSPTWVMIRKATRVSGESPPRIESSTQSILCVFLI